MVSVILSKAFQALEGKKHNTAFGAFIFSVSLVSWVRVGLSRIFLICCTPDFTERRLTANAPMQLLFMDLVQVLAIPCSNQERRLV